MRMISARSAAVARCTPASAITAPYRWGVRALSVVRGSIGPVQRMSADVARRIALGAQGFTDLRPSVATRRHLQRVLSRVQLLQIDSVNVAVRAHYMPLFSRLGAYEPSLLDDAAWTHSSRRPRMLVETWAHEASLV